MDRTFLFDTRNIVKFYLYVNYFYHISLFLKHSPVRFYRHHFPETNRLLILKFFGTNKYRNKKFIQSFSEGIEDDLMKFES